MTKKTMYVLYADDEYAGYVHSAELADVYEQVESLLQLDPIKKVVVRHWGDGFEGFTFEKDEWGTRIGFTLPPSYSANRSAIDRATEFMRVYSQHKSEKEARDSLREEDDHERLALKLTDNGIDTIYVLENRIGDSWDFVQSFYYDEPYPGRAEAIVRACEFMRVYRPAKEE